MTEAGRPADNARTFAQKALARACGHESVAVGEIVDARPDVALSHDNTAPIAEIWRQFGQDRVAIPERMAVTLDHAVPAPTVRHARNHAEVRAFVAEQGVGHFFEVGRGICHQVLSEEALVLPGDVVLGSDSHTPHFGWLGAFGAGVGRSEMAVIWATGELWLRVPESIRIRLEGVLGEWVTTKDVALTLIGDLGADGALYRSVEFDGPAIAGLTLDSRAALVNMMAEMGAKNAYMAPDGAVFRTVAERLVARPGRRAGRGAEPGETVEAVAARLQSGALYPDRGAAYAAGHVLDLAGVEPRVARPHQVDDTVAVGELDSVRVDQAFIGTCTNGRLEDLGAVHRVMAGRRLARGTRMVIVPASSEVWSEALGRGWVADLVAAGAVFGTPGCGPCMGNHLGVLAPGEVCISSANRNFQGRMGDRGAEIYLASPAVVAASAIAGRIVHPREVTE
ncbi:MAG: aconitase/3-isopropylmalate dehydratase large subunit family protein [Acidobacteriota bacterium]|nr:aconitase/3-isopropylmalate dehydratase large subunit family protein [Acidobacteriota bacterium]MDE3265480.1 aconitase/3-isopropylmalate dehydratase large subunit family protein [Acidobacteriota bacterium]